MARFVKCICLLGALLLLFAGITLLAQQNPQRLILKDGSYQTVTKWQVTGNRVRYYSAERYSWEELPNDMVDWPATEKYNKDRDTDREKNVEAIAKADEADQIDRPLVAAGLRLPDAGGIFLLDTYKDQPQLIELSQQGGELNKHTGKNVLRAAVNPLSLSSKQTIELKGARAHTQAHVAQPVIFASVDTIGTQSQDAASALASAGKGRSSSVPAAAPAKDTATPDRYALVRMEKIKDTRVIGSMNVSVSGKVSQKQNLLKVTTTPLGKSWIKITPLEPLTPGEYAVVELLDQGQINLYVWDFGVDPSAPANANAWTAQQPEPGQNGANPGLTKRPPN
jgi:hypothetical protein